MERRHPVKPEWSFTEQCERVAEAGFHGLNIDPDTQFVPEASVSKEALDNAGLTCSMCGFPATVDDMRKCLDWCVDMDANGLVVNARFFPPRPEQAVDFVSACLELGKTSGVPVQFETHRYTLTNGLLFTCELLDRVPDLDLVADLSHYVVGREMPMPVDAFHQRLVAKVLDRSVSVQGRVASREQIQVPLHFQRHKPWVEQFYLWWRQAIRGWLDRAGENRQFNFTCELGPPDYALTDEGGYEFSDRWQESLVLKQVVEGIWKQETQR